MNIEPKNIANNQKQEVYTRISDGGDSNSINVDVYEDGEKVTEAEMSYLTPSEEDANVKPEGEIIVEDEVRDIVIAIAQTNPNISPEFMKLADELEQENQEYLEDQKANSDVEEEEEDEYDNDDSEADSEADSE